MIKKLSREYCLVKYRSLPLLTYDKETDSDVYFCPKIHALYWLKTDGNTKRFLREVEKLIGILGMPTLIFMDEVNKSWISKSTSERKDRKALLKMLDYFKSHKIWTRFNGGVLVTRESLREFFSYFFYITVCDGGFFNFNFIDEEQTMLFYLHYTGELRVIPLTKKANSKFLMAVKKTGLKDVGYPYSERIL